MLKAMLTPDRIAISNILPWMNGTKVTLNTDSSVNSFHCGKLKHKGDEYKTVNVYSLSLQTWNIVVEKLAHVLSEGHLGDYYETVFAELVATKTISFGAVWFAEDQWYEVDSLVDLHKADKMFPADRLVNPGIDQLSATQLLGNVLNQRSLDPI